MKKNITIAVLLSLLSVSTFAENLRFSVKKSFRQSDLNCMFDRPCDFEKMREKAMAKCERKAIYCSTVLRLSVGEKETYSERCGNTVTGMCYVEVVGQRW